MASTPQLRGDDQLADLFSRLLPDLGGEAIVKADAGQGYLTAEREAALAMLDRRKRSGRITLGGDKAYDVTAFIEELSERKVTPHIAINDAVSMAWSAR